MYGKWEKTGVSDHGDGVAFISIGVSVTDGFSPGKRFSEFHCGLTMVLLEAS